MVDVSAREITERTATASAKVTMSSEVLNAIKNGEVQKGDVLATARVAGIMAAKKTSELIPLCHPISIQKVEINFTIESEAIGIQAIVKNVDCTGVEMEALTAVSIAGLTLIDMIKSMDTRAELSDIHIDSKSGGRSGDWVR